MRHLIIAVLSICSFSLAWADENLAGVWSYEGTHLTAISFEDGQEFERVTPAANPRIFIFTAGGHYSQLGITGEEARPLRAESGEGAMGGPKLSNDQRLAEYRPLVAEAGTYRAEDGVIYMRPLIDKVPDYMLGDGQGDSEASYVIEGEVMTFVRTTDAATIRDTYRRLE